MAESGKYILCMKFDYSDYRGSYFLSFIWVNCSAKNVVHLPTLSLKLASTGTLSNSLNAEIIQFSMK